MNRPKDEAALVAYKEWRNGEQWIVCPYCQKKQFPIMPTTVIKRLWYQCKNNKCKKEMLIDMQT